MYYQKKTGPFQVRKKFHTILAEAPALCITGLPKYAVQEYWRDEIRFNLLGPY